ncbi:hypothetical protein KL930_002317 [Ogataea haglerorum]|uniref:Cytoplasmic tRNA 2-thiolation protein 2 n=1 Tax=Ogataea haglerorum TaxID=1937702 RepID=A0AAN6D787_9ASCO|nr:hypothetical protein KL915_001187 [Ogataea haglerorum]KAG7700499.1 hypothetical protein KL951_000614 [Ogataea haglerorum]KAG7709937.1 hypothetical protein KL914_000847 [Ogataea haglerorum]KAG7711282.1 hypothetical protein KL950_001248 [Ogataea haglerorum]KAG7720579.1 hypothetical protein KL913_001479 [Ogataea haglerorum]
MQDEKFKVKFGKSTAERPKVLLPLSYGSSSLALFDMVVSHLEEQCQNERAVQGYVLVVLHVGEDAARMERLRKKYSQVLEKLEAEFVTVDPAVFVRDLARVTVTEEYAVRRTENSESLDLQELLLQFESRSSRQDFWQQVVQEVALRSAVAHDCSVVIFGHSMSRLAEEILALTAKGRGAETAHRLTDGEIEYAGRRLHVIHPLRDVLASEIKEYVRLGGLQEMVATEESVKHKSAKNKTVNELVREYFETVESEYPEVISTVVKIGTKLDSPQGMAQQCILCQEAIYRDPKTWLEQMSESANKEVQSDVPLCYGCLMNLGVGGGAVWPVSRPSREEILAEYILEE